MITINYMKTGGLLYADGKAEESAKLLKEYIINNTNINLNVSSEVFINAVRVLIKEKYFDINDIQIMFNGEIIPFDQDGRSYYWPEGFCDITDDFLIRLLE